MQFEIFSPSIAVNYRTGSGVFFASYSSSFESPTTTEPANLNASGGFDSALDPQTADNYESGFKQARADASNSWSDFKFDRFVEDNGDDFNGKRLPG